MRRKNLRPKSLVGKFAPGIAASALAAAAAQASIDFTSLPGLEGWGSFIGSMDWSYSGAGSGAGILTVTLSNTSPLANGGYLTGFAFNTTGSGLTASLQSGLSGWQGMSNVSASPYENFDFGAAVGGSWLGGGNPNPGIAAGDSASFSFEFTGDDSLLSSLSAASFFDGSSGEAFAARFRGFANGASDKATGELLVTPVPMPLALAGLGVLSLALLRRRVG